MPHPGPVGVGIDSYRPGRSGAQSRVRRAERNEETAYAASQRSGCASAVFIGVRAVHRPPDRRGRLPAAGAKARTSSPSGSVPFLRGRSRESCRESTVGFNVPESEAPKALPAHGKAPPPY